VSNELKKLQAKWYKKLAKEGFKDIEVQESPLEMLHTWDSLYFLSRYTPEQFKAKQLYYERAAQFLHSHVFETSREKSIWEQYSQGLSARAIAKLRRTSTYKIRKIIKNLERLMFGK
jgi:DNA-binding NarL/FixJ family response regulator